MNEQIKKRAYLLLKDEKRSAILFKKWINGQDFEKAAVMLSYTPVNISANILEELEAKEIEKVIKYITSAKTYPDEVVEELFLDFIERV